MDAANETGDVTVVDEYAAYPDFKINVEHEQELIETHDRIVLQFPFYWYSSPALLKQWEDDVIKAGWAYGGGRALEGKEFMLAVSTGPSITLCSTSTMPAATPSLAVWVVDAFKRFFGTVSNKELTIGFLNSLLNKDIKDIIFHNVEMQGNNTDSRKAVFDLFCEGSDGELFIVEIQKKRQKYFSDRVLYYASFVIQMQADIESEKFRLAKEEERRRWNYHINKVYVVCFLDFRLDTRYTDKYRWDVVRMDRELKIPFSETLNEIYLELPKFNLNFEECDTFYKKFLYTMNNIDIMGQLSKETIQNDKLLRKLKSAIELQRMSAKERLAYELSIAAERDLAACMATSFEEGEEKGIAKGITEGMRKIILNMKQAGMDLATIAKTAGLPEKEVEALLK